MNTAKLLIASLLILATANAHAIGRNGPTGSFQKPIGPQGMGSIGGTRTLSGPNANSSFTANGPRGHGVSGEASSTVFGGKATGEATLNTTGGKSATLQGSGQLNGNTASGQGSIQTGAGRGATGEGSISKTDTGINASGSATSNSGKTVSGSLEGNQQSGTVSITTDKGTKTHDYAAPQ
jgi:hypothetical protein